MIHKTKKKIGLFLTHLVLIIGCMIILFPLFWVIRNSLAHKVIIYQYPPPLFFSPTSLNYKQIFIKFPFHLYLFNSFYIAIMTTIISLIVGTFAAYSFARFKTGGSLIPLSILATQMLPPVTLVIPFFLIGRMTNLLNTRALLVVTYMTFNLPFIIWILIGFFQGIPISLEEAAMIDGCTRFQALLRVILPISLPGMLSAALFSFVLSWNEFLFALILSGKQTRTLTVAVSALVTQQGVLIGPVCAAIILIILPMVVLYFFIRHFLVYGLTLGAIK